MNIKLINFSLRPSFKNSPAIQRSLELLDPYFHGEQSWISSGLRTEHDQLTIILGKLTQHKLDDQFDELKKYLGSDLNLLVDVDGFSYYWWQRAWSKLLNIGEIVNPPIPAKVLFDYIRPGSTENRKGQIIGMSQHQHGLAFDIEGNGRLMEKAKLVMAANQEGKCFLHSYLVERKNNAIHCDVEQVGGGTG